MHVGGPGNRSSLLSHTFPSFYACYLLKSVQSTASKATYIGSTPNPPRRIRQHNGELTQGAWKTKRGRPWVMQMIVHNFPSKLAALQFEWAWQHANIARHIKDENGRAFTSAGRSLRQNIQILRFMISIPPYNFWPLHVKIFTLEALKIWEELIGTGNPIKGKGKEKASAIRSMALPPGFTFTVELEGVDGKSTVATGSKRRTKPIQVQDEKFTMAHLNKNTNLLASKGCLICSVCEEPLPDYTSEPLTHALCTHESCNATAHLLCLSKHFLPQGELNSTMIPRGGNCPSCANYVLWGDIVKGCYRRAAGGAISAEEEEETLNEMYNSDSQTDSVRNRGGSKSKGRSNRVVSPRKKRERTGLQLENSSEGEEFDFQEVEDRQYSDDLGVASAAGSPSTIKVGKIKLTLPTPLNSSTPAEAPKSKVASSSARKKRKVARSDKDQESSQGELFDFDSVENLSSTENEGSKRKVGRAKKQLAVSGPSPSKDAVKRRRGRSRKDTPRAGPSSAKMLSTLSKNTLVGNGLSVPPKPSTSALPLFVSDEEDTEIKNAVQNNVLVRSLSSLSITSLSSS